MGYPGAKVGCCFGHDARAVYFIKLRGSSIAEWQTIQEDTVSMSYSQAPKTTTATDRHTVLVTRNKKYEKGFPSNTLKLFGREYMYSPF